MISSLSECNGKYAFRAGVLHRGTRWDNILRVNLLRRFPLRFHNRLCECVAKSRWINKCIIKDYKIIPRFINIYAIFFNRSPVMSSKLFFKPNFIWLCTAEEQSYNECLPHDIIHKYLGGIKQEVNEQASWIMNPSTIIRGQFNNKFGSFKH